MIEVVHTPIQPLADICENKNHLYMKRDDLQTFSLGGNKVRIAHEFLLDFKQKKKDTMILYGDKRSNLCRVLANACYSEHIPCYMIATSTEHGTSKKGNNEWIMDFFPAKIVPCGKDEIAKTVESLMKELEDAGRHPYYIYGNKYGTGNEHVAAGAYAKAYQEILDYEKDNEIVFDYIFHASGTGATQSGLVCGQILHGDDKRIVGISISRDRVRGSQIIEDGVSGYLKSCSMEWQEAMKKKIELADEYRLGGYGLYDHHVEEYIRKQFCVNAVPLDGTYTGKAMWGMEQYLREHKIEHKNILFIHTGGLPLFFDYIQREER